MATWIRISEFCDPAPGTGRAFDVEGLSIAIFNIDGTLHAIDNNCPHEGASLANGRLEGCIVTCAVHGMKVNVVPQTEGMGMNVRTFPVERRLDGVYVDTQAPAP